MTQPADETTEDSPNDDAPASDAPKPPPVSAQEAAQKAADAGTPDPLAQIKISAEAGMRGGSASLIAELNKLPAIPALDGMKANALSGYYGTVPASELAEALAKLPFTDPEAVAQRDALAERAAKGAFAGGR